ncbi:MAG: hypothetical protein MUO26_02620 [Methanotrichaceae archaeon]|nr:hypothetical protein [Methanotrichaceae archaeon]
MHSFLASLSFKRLLWRFFGKRVETLYLPAYSLFAALTVFPLALLLVTFPGRRLYKVSSPWRWLIIAGQALAIFITARAFIDAPHRFSVKQQLFGPEGSQSPEHTRDILLCQRSFSHGRAGSSLAIAHNDYKSVCNNYLDLDLSLSGILALGEEITISVWKRI